MMLGEQEAKILLEIVTTLRTLVQAGREALKLYKDPEIHRLRAENQELNRRLDLKAKTRFENPYYYEEGSEVPLCPKCYASSQGELQVHLTHPSEDGPAGHGRTLLSLPFLFPGGSAKGPNQKGYRLGLAAAFGGLNRYWD
jgi:hypothetical protein